MLMEVPIRVITPANCEKNESGISSFDGARRCSWARALTEGIKMAKAAVLLMKTEMGA